MVGTMEGCYVLHGGKEETAIEVHGLRKRSKEQMEAPAETCECWRSSECLWNLGEYKRVNQYI